MKSVWLPAVAAMLSLAPVVRADDTVRACIAASTEGQTLRQQGKLVEARGSMIACARDACPSIVRSQCARWLSEVESAIPSIVVRAVQAGGEDAVNARLSIDGRPAKLDGQPVRLDPGEHVLAVEEDRVTRTEERVLLVEGEASRRVTIRLPRPAAVAPSSGSEAERGGRRVPTGAWILGGAGVAALGVATYFALAANDQLHQLQSTCSPHCTEGQTQTGRTDALLFDTLLGVGAGAVVGALVWGIAFPSRSEAAALTPRIEVRPAKAGVVTTIALSY